MCYARGVNRVGFLERPHDGAVDGPGKGVRLPVELRVRCWLVVGEGEGGRRAHSVCVEVAVCVREAAGRAASGCCGFMGDQLGLAPQGVTQNSRMIPW